MDDKNYRKVYKYLYLMIDIYYVIKIYFEDLYWKGKLLVRRKYLCLSYVEHENIILIHVKPTTKKLEGKRK